MSKNQNTFAKRQREYNKKQKAEEKRQRKLQKLETKSDEPTDNGPDARELELAEQQLAAQDMPTYGDLRHLRSSSDAK